MTAGRSDEVQCWEEPARPYLPRMGVERAWGGVACENTAAAGVDRGEVSYERSRAVRGSAWLLGEQRG